MLHIHRAERADALIDALGGLLAAPLEDPFAPEVVAVPTRGMERWLAQRASTRLGVSPDRHDGVCANVAFPSPRRLVGAVLAEATGVEPDEDPWRPERAVWALLEVVDACVGEPWLHSLSAHLGAGVDPPDSARGARRFGVVRHLTELFDRYSLHRPEMVRAWAAGDDAQPLGSAAWQAELWRRLRARIASASPAERLETACARLREDAAAVDLPRRLSLFGLTRLPAGELSVLRALADHRDVHLFLLHPSPALWRTIADSPQLPRGAVRRREDRSDDVAANRLLASWGRDAREMQLVLGGAADSDRHHPLELGSATLLARIQSAVQADTAPPGPPLPGREDARPLLGADDRSLQIHACHGRSRQVEVVRDAILHALAEEPTLEPRDVIVMCPDIETFAPLLHAAFGADEPLEDADATEAPPSRSPLIDLRVRLADRSLRPTNPVLSVITQLLDLATARVTASQVLDLADREPVRRRFAFDEDDLARLRAWIDDANIRWGLDAAHREPFRLATVPQGTWRAGLDRLLLGVTMTEDRLRRFHGVLPLDDVDSGAIDLVGRCAELLARLGRAIDALSAPKPIAEWAAAIGEAADSLTATTERDHWQRSALARILDGVVGDATAGGRAAATPLAAAEVRALLAEHLQSRPTRANFRTGHLTICTLHPMRAVPHRVVCLLGLDDDAFPRRAPRDGDDLMLDDPRVGERDPRSEDRQLLLDALMAATDRLIVTYTGNDERTNIPCPPAVPVGELLEIVEGTVRTGGDAPARASVVVHHPLQPFDPRNFAPGALIPRESWSLDPVALEGARALTGPVSAPCPFLSGPLPPLDEDVIELDDLVRFVQHPVRAFLRRRLRVTLTERSDEAEDALPVELDGLQSWAIGQRLLDARLAGVEGRAALLAEIARGALPPGALGKPVIDGIWPIVDAIMARAEPLLAGDVGGGTVDARLTLPDGRRLNGTVTGLRGDVLLAAVYSRIGPRQRLTAWTRLLAATAARPDRAFSAVTIARGAGRAHVAVARIGPLGDDPDTRRSVAIDELASIVELYRRGMREPLPLFCATSAAYAQAAAAGADPLAVARAAWTSEWTRDREDRDGEHRLVFGRQAAFEDLIAAAPATDECGPGWEVAEATRLGRYARRLWDGLLAREELAGR